MSGAGKKLFLPEYRDAAPETLFLYFSRGEILRLDPKKDRLLLENIARNAQGPQQTAALRRLGLDAPPPPNPDFVSDDLFDEAYWLLAEQVRQLETMADHELLRTVAFASRAMAGRFAFCRLTGCRFPAPACDAYSHRDYACGRPAWMTDADVRAFCREMVEKNGPFAAEAGALLHALPPEKGD